MSGYADATLVVNARYPFLKRDAVDFLLAGTILVLLNVLHPSEQAGEDLGGRSFPHNHQKGALGHSLVPPPDES